MSGDEADGTTTTVNAPWAPQGEMLQQLFAAAQGFFEQGAPANFEGDLVADFNPTQLAGQEQALGTVNALNSASRNAISANESLFNADDVGNNQVVQDALQGVINPLTRNFQNKIVPGLKIGGIGAGQTGSSRQGVLEALTTRDFNESTGDLVGRLMGNFYSSGLNAKGAALDRVPGLQRTIGAGARTTTAVGDARQTQEQAEIDAKAFQFNENRDAQLNHLMNFKNLIIGGFGNATGTKESGDDTSHFESDATDAATILASIFSTGGVA